MVKVFAKKEDSDMVTIETMPIEEPNLLDDSTILQKLIDEETKLLQERQDLEVLKENLRKKAKEEIEIRKNKILNLKTEITDSKGTCETLVKLLNMGAQTQCVKEETK